MLGVWTAANWHRDSIEDRALKKAAGDLTKASAALYRAAGQFEKESTDETAASAARQGELRTIYRDVPVRADCAAPAAAGRVLDDAIARANARVAGEPVGAVPADPVPAGAAGGP